MITDKEWRDIEYELAGLFGRVKIKTEDSVLTICRHSLSKDKMVSAVFVDGEYHSSYADEDDPIGKRFYPLIGRRIYTNKQIETMCKGMTKSEMQRHIKSAKLDRCIRFRSWYWSNFVKMKNHLIKNNKELTLIEINDSTVN